MMPKPKTFLSTSLLLQLLLLSFINSNDPKFAVSAQGEEEFGQSMAAYTPGKESKLFNPLAVDEEDEYDDEYYDDEDYDDEYDDDDDDDEDYDDEEYDDEDYDDEDFSGEVYDEKEDFEDDVPKILNMISYGRPQYSNFGDHEMVKKIDETLERSTKYMKEEVYVDPKYEFIRYRCRNFEQMCTIRAAEGYCENEEHRVTMIKKCSPACGTCDVLEAEFYADDALRKREFKLIEDNLQPPSMVMGVQKPAVWGVAQNLGTTEEIQAKVYKVMNSTWDYMWDTVMFGDDSELAIYCDNKHADCSIWSSMGLCETNPGYMQLNCAPACHSCNNMYADKRCPIDPNAPEVLSAPGDLNAIFEHIQTDPYWDSNYGPISVLSSPAMDGAPWVLTLENFLTDAECSRFIEYGQRQGFTPSMDEGRVLFDQKSGSIFDYERNSAEAECRSDCAEDPVLKPVHERVEKLTGFPQENWKWMNILRYEVGQEYKLHTDYIPDEEDFPAGPVALTVYFFLSDVETGGELYMDMLGSEVTIKPKKGMAVVWPSVLDEDASEDDERMYHAGFPVKDGVKYGVTVWMHNRNYKEQLEKKCVYREGADSNLLSPLAE